MRILLAGALVCAVAACGASPPSREITVAMDDYRFLPNVIEIAPGERIRLTLKNIGRQEHDFAPDQRGLAFGVPSFHLGPAASASRDWTAPTTSAEIAVTCTLPGHAQAGMTARIVVR